MAPALTPTLLDHALALAFGVLLPAYSACVRAPRLKRLAPAQLPGARRRAYLGILVQQWTLATILLAHTLDQGRPLADVGLVSPRGWGGWVALALAAAALGFLALQRRRLKELPHAAEQVADAIGHVSWLLPASRSELRLFLVVAVTAGVCEELYFRGFLLVYLDAYVGWPLACTLGVLWFALGHAYQGPRGVLQTGVAGGLCLGLRLLGGSLWAPILLHAGLDAHSGVLVQWVKQQLGGELTARTPPPAR